MTILVTGGAGRLGRAVVDRLLRDGHAPRVASRGVAPGPLPYDWRTVDYRSGAGLAEAVTGADAIIHCAGEIHRTNADRRLIEAAKRAGDPHLVYISIVGVDRVPHLYYRTKLAAERLVERSGLPWTVLRATQFHEFVGLVWGGLARLPVVPVPAGTSMQPVDTREVADRLVELATGTPVGRAADIAGPEIRPVAELVRAYLRARGLRRAVLPVRLPGKAFRAYRQGGHLAPDHAVGRITFHEFLAERVRPAGAEGSRR